MLTWPPGYEINAGKPQMSTNMHADEFLLLGPAFSQQVRARHHMGYSLNSLKGLFRGLYGGLL